MVRQSVVLVVHPVNTTEHPTYLPGYRWAVMVGTSSPTALECCVGAGHASQERDATLQGETVAAAVCIALGLSGVQVDATTTTLGHDPIPGAADHGGNRIFIPRRSN